MLRTIISGNQGAGLVVLKEATHGPDYWNGTDYTWSRFPWFSFEGLGVTGVTGKLKVAVVCPRAFQSSFAFFVQLTGPACPDAPSSFQIVSGRGCAGFAVPR